MFLITLWRRAAGTPATGVWVFTIAMGRQMLRVNSAIMAAFGMSRWMLMLHLHQAVGAWPLGALQALCRRILHNSLLVLLAPASRCIWHSHERISRLLGKVC